MSYHELVEPTRPDQRLVTLDVIRGVAICAILPVNMLVMGTVGGQDGLLSPAVWNADWISWIFIQAVLVGASRGLFTFLFGAGFLLMLRRAEGVRASVAPLDVWSRRCLALLTLGVMQFAVFLWPGEILWTYGIAGLFLLAFRSARPRTLFIVGATIILGTSALRVATKLPLFEKVEAGVSAQRARDSGKPLRPFQVRAVATVDSMNANPEPKDVAAEVQQRTHLPSLFFWSASGWADRHLALFSWPPLAETVSFMIIGMALYRTGVLTGAADTALYWRLLVFGYAIGLGFRFLDLGWQARTAFMWDLRKAIPVFSLIEAGAEEPVRLATTLGHLGLVVILFRSGVLSQAKTLQALGRMALTVYSLQSILTSIIFYLFGYIGCFGPIGLLGLSIAIWLLTAALCVAWLRFSTMGPAEWFLRAVAYGRAPPLWRTSAPTSTAA